MNTFEEYLDRIENLENRAKLKEILDWIDKKYPELDKRIAWNQPMFTKDGTFIIGFSVAKNHISIAPEKAGLNRFSDDIVESGYNHSKEIFRILWNQKIDYKLFEKIIDYNIEDKKDCKTFWRK